jgi:hypothetical protein
MIDLMKMKSINSYDTLMILLWSIITLMIDLMKMKSINSYDTLMM